MIGMQLSTHAESPGVLPFAWQPADTSEFGVQCVYMMP